MKNRRQPPYRRLHPLYFGGDNTNPNTHQTPPVGTSNNQYATTAFVAQAIEDALADFAPAESGCCEPVAVAGELVFDGSGDVITTHTE